MRRWTKLREDRQFCGFPFNRFGPLSHVRAGMLTYMVSDSHLHCLSGAPHSAVVLCPHEDVELAGVMGPNVVGSDDPEAEFWREFCDASESHAFEGDHIRAQIKSPTGRLDRDPTARIEPHASVGIPPFKLVRPVPHGRRRLAPHVGGVMIGEGSFIGANSTVQAGIFGEWTEIGKDVFIDSHVHIGHGCMIGCGATITAGVVLAGWCVVGDGAWIGINASVKQHTKIGAGAVVGMGSVVIQDVPPNVTVAGNPARIIGSKS